MAGALEDDTTRALFVKTVWSYALFDFMVCVEVAAEKVLKDASVSKEVRLRRAKGLLLAGDMLQEAAPENDDVGLEELSRRIGEALSVQKKVAQQTTAA